MSGNNFKCGIHRFDGHGTNSYRPKDPTTSQIPLQLASMKAERDRQDNLWNGRVDSLPQQPTQPTQLTQPTKPTNNYESRPPWLVQQKPK
jgi:hypothetical protein